VETEYGRKRQIDQSTCTKDYSCLKGFCPSFVTVLGGSLKKPAAASLDPALEAHFAAMPAPALDPLDKPQAILVTGIGGTGVVTIGAILAMAAHIEGKGATTMDQTGLAQKGGAVTSHIRLARSPADIHTVRIGVAGADTIIGADMLVTADGDTLSKIRPADAASEIGRTRVFLNTHRAQTGEFTKKPDWRIPVDTVFGQVARACGQENLDLVDATRLATRLMGDSIATNMFMLGYAWQKGAVPVDEGAILAAIALNGAAVQMNQNAFLWGRRAAYDLARVMEAAAEPDRPAGHHRRIAETPEESFQRRIEMLAVEMESIAASLLAKLYQPQ
jgi:indolepyruvate ferredoxin oxidoreductase